MRGFLEAEAAVGEPRAAVCTLAARRVEGTLVRLHPAPGHSFGVPRVQSCSRSAASCARGWRSRQVADRSYEAVLARRGEIQRRAVGVDYEAFEQDGVAFDYEALLRSSGYGLDDVVRIQREAKVGGTPLLELPRLTQLARDLAAPGKGATILVKDEAVNASGSFKARRAAVAVHEAARLGYEGVIAATSGNYGAAVASQAAMRGLACIVLQEVFDSAGRGQPEIVEKGRACESYGAEVWQLTVGPELFYTMLLLLEETVYFSASLYTPHAVAGIETLGLEIGEEVRRRYGRDPDAVVVTHAGGGNVTGTARGLRAAGCDASLIVGVSVDRHGLRMDSDSDFNRKSFTTGHTGFGVPFLVNPDRVDVPRNAARPLRYLDRYVTVTQGEVFYMTEALAQLQGPERGPPEHVPRGRVRAGAGARPRRRRRSPGDGVHGCGQAPDRAAHVRPRPRRRGAARRSGRERAGPGDRHTRVAGATPGRGRRPRRDPAFVPAARAHRAAALG